MRSKRAIILKKCLSKLGISHKLIYLYGTRVMLIYFCFPKTVLILRERFANYLSAVCNLYFILTGFLFPTAAVWRIV